jgi:hypothetical protein
LPGDRFVGADGCTDGQPRLASHQIHFAGAQLAGTCGGINL